MATANKTGKTKFFCHCSMPNDSEIFLPIKAETETEASLKVHQGYKIDYVIEVLTTEEMERRKKHLRPGISAGVHSLT